MPTPRTALVTGAAQGIGLACTRRLSDDGLRVIATDIQPTPQEREILDNPNVEYRILDVTNPTAVAEVVADTGPVDVLVNSAGVVGPNVPFCTTSKATLRSLNKSWQQVPGSPTSSTSGPSRSHSVAMTDRVELRSTWWVR